MLPPTLRNLAWQQKGVVSRSQALRAGLSSDMIKFRLHSGRWQPVYPGIYLTFTGAPGRSAQLWAALLGAGPGAVLSHETAAELQRLCDKPADSIHVTVPWQRRVKLVNGVSLHRSMQVGEIVPGHGTPPQTRVERTVLDLAQAAATFDEVCGWVTRAFARDLTDAASLRAAMEQRTRLRWRADLHELIAAAASGDHSATPPPRTASRRSGTDGRTSPGTPAKPHGKSPRSFESAAGPAVPAHARPAVPRPAYTNALIPVMVRPTIRVFISRVPS